MTSDTIKLIIATFCQQDRILIFFGLYLIITVVVTNSQRYDMTNIQLNSKQSHLYPKYKTYLVLMKTVIFMPPLMYILSILMGVCIVIWGEYFGFMSLLSCTRSWCCHSCLKTRAIDGSTTNVWIIEYKYTNPILWRWEQLQSMRGGWSEESYTRAA